MKKKLKRSDANTGHPHSPLVQNAEVFFILMSNHSLNFSIPEGKSKNSRGIHSYLTGYHRFRFGRAVDMTIHNIQYMIIF